MKVGSVRIVKPAKRIRTVAFPIKNTDPDLGLAGSDDEEEEEERKIEENALADVERVNSFVMPTNLI
jgi:hypothetical protein